MSRTAHSGASASSTGGLEYAIAVACKDTYTITTIDGIFTSCGCEVGWWTEPTNDASSARMRQVFGWFAGIRAHAPDSLWAITRNVGDYIVSDLYVEARHKDIIRAALEKLDGVVRPQHPFDRFNFHPKVKELAGALFNDGHYRMALFQTYLSLVAAVKDKSGRTDIDNTPLMQHVFSPSRPVLECSSDKDEQTGYMWLFSGAVMAIRNPRGHTLDDGRDDDVDQTLEWLAFASALFRVLDRAKLRRTGSGNE